MDYEGSPEPIDFDFFDDGPSTKRSGRLQSPDHSSKPTRPLSGKRSNSARGNDGDYDRDSVRSVASSRSSVSVRIPTATPTRDDGNDADYYSDDFDSDRDNDRGKNTDDFRFKDDIGVFHKDSKTSETKSNSKGKSKTKSKSEDREHLLPNSSKSNSKNDGKSRPKSSVVRRRQRTDSSSSNDSTDSTLSRSSESFTSESTRSSQSEKDNESVTSVSPLQSPASSPIPKLEYDEQEMERETERLRSVRFEEDETEMDGRFLSGTKNGKTRPKTSKSRARPHSSPVKTPGYSNYRENPPMRATEANELSMLLRAVLEMDETPDSSELSAIHADLKKPLSGKRKNRPQSAPMPHQRMNLSFSNDEVKRIDRENRRLLEKIVNKSATPAARAPSHVPRQANKKPVSHSAVRRQRDQRRIEIENMQILKRIESARANPQIKKDSLLNDFHQQKRYANQVSKSPGALSSRPTSAKRSGKSYSSTGMSKASSMSSLGTDYTVETCTSSSSSRSRPRSGRSSGYGGAKPAWDDRFYLNQ